MTVCATATGKPRWRSPQALIMGPSLSRKIRLSSMNERNTTSDVSALIPAPSPFSKAWNASLEDELALSLAFCAVSLSIPRSCSHPWTLSAACWRFEVRPSA